MISFRYSTGGFASAIFSFKSYNKDNSISCVFKFPIDQDCIRKFKSEIFCYKDGFGTDTLIADSVADKIGFMRFHIDPDSIDYVYHYGWHYEWIGGKIPTPNVDLTWFKFIGLDNEMINDANLKYYKGIDVLHNSLTKPYENTLIDESTRGNVCLFDVFNVDREIRHGLISSNLFISREIKRGFKSSCKFLDVANARSLNNDNAFNFNIYKPDVLGSVEHSGFNVTETDNLGSIEYAGFNIMETDNVATIEFSDLNVYETDNIAWINSEDMRFHRRMKMRYQSDSISLGKFTYDVDKIDVTKSLFVPVDKLRYIQTHKMFTVPDNILDIQKDATKAFLSNRGLTNLPYENKSLFKSEASIRNDATFDMADKHNSSLMINDNLLFTSHSNSKLNVNITSLSLVNDNNKIGYSSFIFAKADDKDIDLSNTSVRLSEYAKYLLRQDAGMLLSESESEINVNNSNVFAAKEHNKIHKLDAGLGLMQKEKEVNVNNHFNFVDSGLKSIFSLESEFAYSKHSNVFGESNLWLGIGSSNINYYNGNMHLSKHNNKAMLNEIFTLFRDNNFTRIDDGLFVNNSTYSLSVDKNLQAYYSYSEVIVGNDHIPISSTDKSLKFDKSIFAELGDKYVDIFSTLFARNYNKYSYIDSNLFVNFSNSEILVGNNDVLLSSTDNYAIINEYTHAFQYNKYAFTFDGLSSLEKKDLSLNINKSTMLNIGSNSIYIDKSNDFVSIDNKFLNVLDQNIFAISHNKYTYILDQILLTSHNKYLSKDLLYKSLDFEGKSLGIFSTKALSKSYSNLFNYSFDKSLVDSKQDIYIYSNMSLVQGKSNLEYTNDLVYLDKVQHLCNKFKVEYYGMSKAMQTRLFSGDTFGYVKDFLPPIEILKDANDELLLPRDKFDYSKYESRVFGKNLIPQRKYIKGYTDNGDPIINIPLENPITYYADIAKDYMDVDVRIMRKVLELLYNNWRKNIHRYAGIEAVKAINNILEFTHEDLKEWYTSTTDPSRVKHAERSLKLFAWYSEMAILTHSDYSIAYEMADGVFDFWDKLPTYSLNPSDVVFGIKEDEILEVTNFVHDQKPYILSSVPGQGATIQIDNLPQCCETVLTFSGFIFGDGELTVSTSDNIYKFNSKRNEVEIVLPKDDNGFTISFEASKDISYIDISKFKIHNRYNLDYDLNYTGKVSNVNFTVQYILDVMSITGDSVEQIQPVFKTTAPLAHALEQFKTYMEIHHDKKYKGKRLTIRK